MSLNAAQRARTADELGRNMERSGLAEAEAASALGFSRERLGAALRSEGHPEDVWLLRDFLERAIRRRGLEPVPYTVLDEAARVRARAWFDLRTPPEP